MATKERQRRTLHGELCAALGDETADLLVTHLPPVGFEDLATKRDLEQVRTELKGDMATLRTELKGDIAELRAELKGDLATTEQRLIATLRAEIASTLQAQTKLFVGAYFGTVVSFGGLAFAAARLE